ncbi:MAG: methylmalonyl-CoA epimerase [Gemmatimonadota bacterium]|nr:methylmalonyl-CoA epimerase [Gemmatimonadota bacterium]
MTQSQETRRKLDHVAVAVKSIEESRHLFELVSGEACSTPQTLSEHGVRVAFVGHLELVEPLDTNSGVARFLQRHGQGLHHVAYRTDDLDGDLLQFKAKGIEPVGQIPQSGASGHRVAFLRPSSTAGVLIELVEYP